MESIAFEFPATGQVVGRAVVGVVGSGDLEVLLEPGAPGAVHVYVNTSVDGRRQTWGALLNRIFRSGTMSAARMEINDCGATPGVVRLRVEQAFEQAEAF